jgi:hypothetical protein
MTRHTTIRIRPGSALERELAAAKARGQGITDYLHELGAIAAATADSEIDDEDHLEDAIQDAIDDSIDQDWRPIDGARAVVARLKGTGCIRYRVAR